VRGTRSGSIPEDLVAPLAWRRYSDDKNQSVLELVSCMPMDPTYGLYRGDLLLDDYKGGSVNGPHRVDLYRLVASPGGSLGWRVDGTAGSGWGDCFNTGDWLGAVGDWQPSSPSWALLES
ncbi:hypothetical protein OAG98_03010, partial [Acidimicrobiales bacterium]|nr:hypothetical protein [Acidimicrobiales bacterium]